MNGPGLHSRWRPWPESFAGWISLILVVSFAAVILTGAILLMREHMRGAMQDFADQAAARIAVSVEQIEQVYSPAERHAYVRAMRSPNFRVRLIAVPPPWRGSLEPQDPELLLLVREHLRSLGDRPITARLLQEGQDEGAFHRLWRRPYALDIAVGLRTGGWLMFRILPPHRPWRFRPWIWLGITVLLVVGAAVWAAHRMTRPLRSFAEAADRLGLDQTAPPLPEYGPGELRNATRAFNRMQERISKLVDDRTLMLAAVSHDLRTMLTRLRLRAEFIDDDEQKNKAIGDLDEMQAMLDATLSFARDDSADEKPLKLDLAAMLQSLCDDLADAGANAAYDGPDRLPVRGRPVALRRAFANLLENALRYGDEALARLHADGDSVTVEIADRGPGIPPELRERVFDPFFRMESSRNRDTGGAGLGLAVVRAVAHRHGGGIVIEDRPGGGLIFRVRLPH